MFESSFIIEILKICMFSTNSNKTTQVSVDLFKDISFSLIPDN